MSGITLMSTINWIIKMHLPDHLISWLGYVNSRLMMRNDQKKNKKLRTPYLAGKYREFRILRFV